MSDVNASSRTRIKQNGQGGAALELVALAAASAIADCQKAIAELRGEIKLVKWVAASIPRSQ